MSAIRGRRQPRPATSGHRRSGSASRPLATAPGARSVPDESTADKRVAALRHRVSALTLQCKRQHARSKRMLADIHARDRKIEELHVAVTQTGADTVASAAESVAALQSLHHQVRTLEAALLQKQHEADLLGRDHALARALELECEVAALADENARLREGRGLPRRLIGRLSIDPEPEPEAPPSPPRAAAAAAAPSSPAGARKAAAPVSNHRPPTAPRRRLPVDGVPGRISALDDRPDPRRTAALAERAQRKKQAEASVAAEGRRMDEERARLEARARIEASQRRALASRARDLHAKRMRILELRRRAEEDEERRARLEGVVEKEEERLRVVQRATGEGSARSGAREAWPARLRSRRSGGAAAHTHRVRDLRAQRPSSRRHREEEEEEEGLSTPSPLSGDEDSLGYARGGSQGPRSHTPPPGSAPGSTAEGFAYREGESDALALWSPAASTDGSDNPDGPTNRRYALREQGSDLSLGADLLSVASEEGNAPGPPPADEGSPTPAMASAAAALLLAPGSELTLSVTVASLAAQSGVGGPALTYPYVSTWAEPQGRACTAAVTEASFDTGHRALWGGDGAGTTAVTLDPLAPDTAHSDAPWSALVHRCHAQPFASAEDAARVLDPSQCSTLLLDFTVCLEAFNQGSATRADAVGRAAIPLSSLALALVRNAVAGRAPQASARHALDCGNGLAVDVEVTLRAGPRGAALARDVHSAASAGGRVERAPTLASASEPSLESGSQGNRQEREEKEEEAGDEEGEDEDEGQVEEEEEARLSADDQPPEPAPATEPSLSAPSTLSATSAQSQAVHPELAPPRMDAAVRAAAEALIGAPAVLHVTLVSAEGLPDALAPAVEAWVPPLRGRAQSTLPAQAAGGAVQWSAQHRCTLSLALPAVACVARGTRRRRGVKVPSGDDFEGPVALEDLCLRLSVADGPSDGPQRELSTADVPLSLFLVELAEEWVREGSTSSEGEEESESSSPRSRWSKLPNSLPGDLFPRTLHVPLRRGTAGAGTLTVDATYEPLSRGALEAQLAVHTSVLQATVEVPAAVADASGQEVECAVWAEPWCFPCDDVGRFDPARLPSCDASLIARRLSPVPGQGPAGCFPLTLAIPGLGVSWSAAGAALRGERPVQWSDSSASAAHAGAMAVTSGEEWADRALDRVAVGIAVCARGQGGTRTVLAQGRVPMEDLLAARAEGVSSAALSVSLTQAQNAEAAPVPAVLRCARVLPVGDMGSRSIAARDSLAAVCRQPPLAVGGTSPFSLRHAAAQPWVLHARVAAAAGSLQLSEGGGDPLWTVRTGSASAAALRCTPGTRVSGRDVALAVPGFGHPARVVSSAADSHGVEAAAEEEEEEEEEEEGREQEILGDLRASLPCSSGHAYHSLPLARAVRVTATSRALHDEDEEGGVVGAAPLAEIVQTPDGAGACILLFEAVLGGGEGKEEEEQGSKARGVLYRPAVVEVEVFPADEGSREEEEEASAQRARLWVGPDPGKASPVGAVEVPVGASRVRTCAPSLLHARLLFPGVQDAAAPLPELCIALGPRHAEGGVTGSLPLLKLASGAIAAPGVWQDAQVLLHRHSAEEEEEEEGEEILVRARLLPSGGWDAVTAPSRDRGREVEEEGASLAAGVRALLLGPCGVVLTPLALRTIFPTPPHLVARGGDVGDTLAGGAASSKAAVVHLTGHSDSDSSGSGGSSGSRAWEWPWHSPAHLRTEVCGCSWPPQVAVQVAGGGVMEASAHIDLRPAALSLLLASRAMARGKACSGVAADAVVVVHLREGERSGEGGEKAAAASRSAHLLALRVHLKPAAWAPYGEWTQQAAVAALARMAGTLRLVPRALTAAAAGADRGAEEAWIQVHPPRLATAQSSSAGQRSLKGACWEWEEGDWSTGVALALPGGEDAGGDVLRAVTGSGSVVGEVRAAGLLTLCLAERAAAAAEGREPVAVPVNLALDDSASVTMTGRVDWQPRDCEGREVTAWLRSLLSQQASPWRGVLPSSEQRQQQQRGRQRPGSRRTRGYAARRGSVTAEEAKAPRPGKESPAPGIEEEDEEEEQESDPEAALRDLIGSGFVLRVRVVSALDTAGGAAWRGPDVGVEGELWPWGEQSRAAGVTDSGGGGGDYGALAFEVEPDDALAMSPALSSELSLVLRLVAGGAEGERQSLGEGAVSLYEPLLGAAAGPERRGSCAVELHDAAGESVGTVEASVWVE